MAFYYRTCLQQFTLSKSRRVLRWVFRLLLSLSQRLHWDKLWNYFTRYFMHGSQINLRYQLNFCSFSKSIWLKCFKVYFVYFQWNTVQAPHAEMQVPVLRNWMVSVVPVTRISQDRNAKMCVIYSHQIYTILRIAYIYVYKYI